MRPLLLALVLCAPLYATTSVEEDFESHEVGTPAAEAGWKYFAGTGSLDQLAITTPASTDNSSSRCLTGNPDGPDVQVYKAFPATFDVSDATTDIDYSVKIFPRASGQVVPRLLFGVRTAEEKQLYLFGIEANEFSTAKFAFRVGSAVSQQFFPVGDLYEVRLTIELQKGLAAATGSLSIKDLTKGDSDWDPIEDLQHVPLKLVESFSPLNWTDWLIRGGYRREVDDLRLSLHEAQN